MLGQDWSFTIMQYHNFGEEIRYPTKNPSLSLQATIQLASFSTFCCFRNWRLVKAKFLHQVILPNFSRIGLISNLIFEYPSEKFGLLWNDATVFEVVIDFDSFPPDLLVFFAGAPDIFRQSLVFWHCSQCISWDEVHILVWLKLLLEDRVGAFVYVLILVSNREERFYLGSNGVYDVITYRPDLLLSDGLSQLLQSSFVSLSVDGERHSSYEADGEKRKELTKLALLNLIEDSGTQPYKCLVLAQAKAKKVVRPVLFEYLELFSIIRHSHQKLLLIDLQSNVVSNPSFYIEIAFLFILAIISWLLSGFFLYATVHLPELEVFLGQLRKDGTEVLSKACVKIGTVFIQSFQEVLGEEDAIEYLELRMDSFDGCWLRPRVAVSHEYALDQVIEGEAEMLLVYELLVCF